MPKSSLRFQFVLSYAILCILVFVVSGWRRPFDCAVSGKQLYKKRKSFLPNLIFYPFYYFHYSDRRVVYFYLSAGHRPAEQPSEIFGI